MDPLISYNASSEATEAIQPTLQMPAPLTAEGGENTFAPNAPLFKNPFRIEDLLAFDDATMHRIFSSDGFGITLEYLALSMHNAPTMLVKRIGRNLPSQQRSSFIQALRSPATKVDVKAAQRRVLDSLFWELTYWKTPKLYDELTEGEQLHPGIFQQLEPDIRGKTVLDAGAGCGRASFECLRYGARLVYAVEPSPGLLHLLEHKLANQLAASCIIPYQGSFNALPLEDKSVDIALSCSAFTAEPEQGGEPGLAELRRVTKSGGKVVLIWPRTQDHEWLAAHGFHYVALPIQMDMFVHFRSFHSALRCARRFYAQNKAVLAYILKRHQAEVPFSVLGVNPPIDYCWLPVN